ncbi:MAG: hypothetical protein IPG76_00020 [Acidobacteria bacterium]|nr:hypothetical protein [Acidobacteriota bacterium]
MAHPGTASFSVNGGAPIVELGNSTGASHVFNMGKDFIPSFAPSSVTIIPTNAEGQKGSSFIEYVYVFPHPTWLEKAVNASSTSLKETGDSPNSGINISFGLEVPTPHLGAKHKTNIPSWLTPILGERFGPKETFITINGSINTGSGIGNLNGYVQSGFEVQNKSVDFTGGGSGTFRLGPPKGWEIIDATLFVSGTATITNEYKIDKILPGFKKVENVPVLGDMIKWLNQSASLQWEISPSLKLSAVWGQDEATGDLGFKGGEGKVELSTKGILKIDIPNNNLSVRDG